MESNGLQTNMLDGGQHQCRRLESQRLFVSEELGRSV